MTHRDFDSFDDAELKVGIARAFDLTLEKCAEIAGISIPTVQRWLSLPNVQRLMSIHRTIQALRTEKAATDVVRTAKERMSWVFDESFKLTERLITKAMNKGDEIEIEELMEIHKNITVWSAKYQISEAPKRVSLEGEVKHAHVHVLSMTEAAGLLETRKMIAAAQPALPVIDVEPVEASN